MMENRNQDSKRDLLQNSKPGRKYVSTPYVRTYFIMDTNVLLRTYVVKRCLRNRTARIILIAHDNFTQLILTETAHELSNNVLLHHTSPLSKGCRQHPSDQFEVVGPTALLVFPSVLSFRCSLELFHTQSRGWDPCDQ